MQDTHTHTQTTNYYKYNLKNYLHVVFHLQVVSKSFFGGPQKVLHHKCPILLDVYCFFLVAFDM